jgi:hypothetical protein
MIERPISSFCKSDRLLGFPLSRLRRDLLLDIFFLFYFKH